MDNIDDESEKPKLRTPRRTLGLGLRSPRIVPSQRTPSQVKRFQSPLIDDSIVTPQKKKRLSYADSKTSMMSPQASTSNEVTDTRSVGEMNTNNEPVKSTRIEKYKNQIKELEDLIEIWRNGGERALQMLQDTMEPKQELDAILAHLHLPLDIFDVKKIN